MREVSVGRWEWHCPWEEGTTQAEYQDRRPNYNQDALVSLNDMSLNAFEVLGYSRASEPMLTRVTCFADGGFMDSRNIYVLLKRSQRGEGCSGIQYFGRRCTYVPSHMKQEPKRERARTQHAHS